MFHLQVDLGQLIITAVMATIGWSITTLVKRIYQTLDDHDKKIQDLVGKVNFLIGLAGWKDKQDV